MGFILIIIGVIIQYGLANSRRESEKFFENSSQFMTNSSSRGILTLISWILIIVGVISLF